MKTGSWLAAGIVIGCLGAGAVFVGSSRKGGAPRGADGSSTSPVTSAPTASADGAALTTASTSARPAPVEAPASAEASSASAPPRTAASAAWPAPDTPPPSEAEWSAAADANGSDPKLQNKACSLKRVREWFRARCEKGPGMTGAVDLGKRGSDFFTKADQVGSEVTVRSVPGHIESAVFPFDGLPVHLWIGWPSDEPSATLAFLDTRQVGSMLDLDAHEPGDVPPIVSRPLADSPRPPDADWLKGTEVNTADKVRRLPGCSIRIVRDWCRLRCGSNGHAVVFQNLVGAELNKDYFTVAQLSDTEVIAHMRPGPDMQMLITGTPNGIFEIVWPEGASRPAGIRVERTEN